jgi:hypothetical protein
VEGGVTALVDLEDVHRELGRPVDVRDHAADRARTA